MVELGIIILNYRTPNLVRDCLESLKSQVEKYNRKVIVVDNASPDDSAKYLSKIISENNWQSWVELVCAEKNGGFAAGNNIGIKKIEAKYYLLLNSDTIVKEGCLDKMLTKFNEQRELGILSAHLEGANAEKQTTRFRFITPLSEFVTNLNIGVVNKLLRPWQVPVLENEKLIVQWVCFAAVMIKKDVFKKIGLLDEKFFMYFEDVDFCKRATENLIKIDVCDNATVIHLMGSSSGLSSSDSGYLKRKPRYYYEARSYYFYKHYNGVFGNFLANLAWLFGRAASNLYELFKKRRQTWHEKDYLDIWISWNKRD